MHAKWDSHSWLCVCVCACASQLTNIFQISLVNGLYYHISALLSEHGSLRAISVCCGFSIFPDIVDGYWVVCLQMLPCAKLSCVAMHKSIVFCTMWRVRWLAIWTSPPDLQQNRTIIWRDVELLPQLATVSARLQFVFPLGAFCNVSALMVSWVTLNGWDAALLRLTAFELGCSTFWRLLKPDLKKEKKITSGPKSVWTLYWTRRMPLTARA